MSETARLVLTGLAYGGDALGRLPSGKAVFVPLGAPGDEVSVAIVEDKPTHARARLLEVHAPGPARREPPCGHFPACGGCQLLHMTEEAQRQAREQAFYDALGRLGGVPREGVAEAWPIAHSPQPLGYRVRCTLHVQGRTVGFRARRGRDLVRIERCLLLAPALEALRCAVTDALDRSPIAGLEDVELCVGANGKGAASLVFSRPIGGAQRKAATATLGRVPGLQGVLVRPRDGTSEPAWGQAIVRRPAPCCEGAELLGRPDLFAQANPDANALLVRAVLDGLAPRAQDRVLELYGGAGNFTLAVASSGAHVTAVEEVPASLDLARQAANAAGLGAQVRFVVADAVGTCQGLARQGDRFDLALLDPPRQGAKALPAALAALEPRRIAYVSCDPTTLGRDVKALTALGYRVVKAQPFDMFPQTYHVEGLVLLERS